ncbi:MAG: hypothetical protein IT369_17085 [Candidatus Latescibacteria bacterium]|nr:hypothetical protein [Candidatus Latescibacterota bacterium]
MNESTMQGYSNTNTIFAAFSQEGFRRKLEQLALELDCRVYWAEYPADLIAIPWFVAIVDRRVLGDHSWCLYEQYRAEIGEPELCILIDDGPPSSLALQQVPFLADSSEEELMKVVRAAHAMSSQVISAQGD